MADEGAAAPPPPQAPSGGTGADTNQSDAEKGKWPPPEEQLEKWMMNTVKEGDAGAKFVRTMLQMNPAYGTYLQTDEDLVNVVLQFSKRIKTKIAHFEAPSNMPPNYLVQPLCELVWRVVGYVMHGVIELEEEANMPVPKEASGMIKMLLHTNSQLSAKLNDLRRVYLRELAEHRDRQRRISKTAERAIATLQEQPIMFFEPLEFVLDETTKDFVREAVVERIKLEMRTAAMNSDENAEMSRYIEELEAQVDLLKAEVKTSKATNKRLEEQMKTITMRETKLREDLKERDDELKEARKQIEDLEAQLKKLQGELANKDRKIAHLEAKLGETPTTVTETKTEVQYVDHSEEMDALSSKNIDLENANKKLTDELERLKKQLADQIAAMKNSGNQVVMQEDPETRKLLEQALEVEKELRAANERLQRLLDEAEAENEDLRKQLDKKGGKKSSDDDADSKKKKKERASGPSPEELEAIKEEAIAKALKKMKKEYEEEIERLKARNDKLEGKLEKAEKRIEELEDEVAALTGKPKKEKVVKQVGVPEEEHTKLKVRCHELEQKLELVEDEYAKLEQKVAMLMDKLKEKFSDNEIGDLLEKIKLAPPPIRKKRKKKAYERLYDDAQRRIMEIKMRQEMLKELEERSLRNMARIVANSRERSKVAMLGKLQKASQQTSQRFHEALAHFQRMQSSMPLSGDDEYEDDDVMRRIDRLTDLEEMTIQCFKDGVCPRCAFSALATFRSQSGGLGGSQMIRAMTDSGLTYHGPGGKEFGTPWQANQSIGSQARSSSPPWERSNSGSRGSSPQGQKSGSLKWQGDRDSRRLGSPVSAGPAPGAMPYDSAYPMPAPPWRRESPEPGPEPMPMQQEPLSLSSSITDEASLPSREPINSIPPWRRARSNSPAKGSRSPSPTMAKAEVRRPAQPVQSKSMGSLPARDPAAPQPPDGIGAPAPPKGFAASAGSGPTVPGMAQSQSYSRLGRPAADWLPPAPVPGRVPAAQSMMLDPISKSVGASTKSGSSRSRSPGKSPRGGIASDGFRKMRPLQAESGTPFDMGDNSRPNTVPPLAKAPPGWSQHDGMRQGHPEGRSHLLGGGGFGTQYANISSNQPPTVPSSRHSSMPMLPAATNQMPWRKKPGPGFVVAPVASQEGIARGGI